MLTGLPGVCIGLIGIVIGNYMKKKNARNMQELEERRKEREPEKQGQP